MRSPLFVFVVMLLVIPAMAAPFVSNVTGGAITVPVKFSCTGTSVESPESWSWTLKNIAVSASETKFSTLQNPIETFGPGNFSIRLTVRNSSYSYTSPDLSYFVNVSGAGTINQAEGFRLLNDIPLVPSDNIWKAPVDHLPIDPRSKMYIRASRPSSYIYIAKAFTINVVNSSTKKQNYSIVTWPTYSDLMPIPIPDNPVIETMGVDKHMLIVDKDTSTSYESYATERLANGTFKTIVTKTYDLTSNALPADNKWTAEAAGLQMTPGILRYEEILNGSVDHAIRAAFYSSGNTHVWPARADGSLADLSYPGFGQRFRLNASFDDSGFSPHNKIIITALKKYGIMLADNSGDPNAWLLSADTDPRWGETWYGIGSTWLEFQKMHASDFEAVNATVLMINRSSGQANLPMAPVASFSADPRSGIIPFIVVFTDTTPYSSATSWYWEFGDGSTSNSHNPTHAYTIGATYNVNLKVTNDFGSSWENKTAYITSYANHWNAYSNDPLSMFHNTWGMICGVIAIIITGLVLYYLKWRKYP